MLHMFSIRIFQICKIPEPHIGTLINVDEKIFVASVFVQTNRDTPKIFEWRTHVTNYKVVISRQFYRIWYMKMISRPILEIFSTPIWPLLVF